MAVVTLEDLQGTLEVVVFPKLYEQTAGTWQEGAILLVAGRVDHRGEEVSLLADLVVDWDRAVARGPEAFGREVAAGDRGSFRRRGSNGANGSNGGSPRNGNGHASVPGSVPAPGGAADEARPREPIAVGPGRSVPAGRVSPLRPDAIVDAPAAPLPRIRPAEPVSADPEPPGAGPFPDHDHEEPALPDEARDAAFDAVAEPTRPLTAGPGHVLHVRFRGESTDRLFDAMRAFRALIRERPGNTPVLVHLDVGGATGLPMALKPVAYDADLLAEIGRRLGDGAVDLQLA